MNKKLEESKRIRRVHALHFYYKVRERALDVLGAVCKYCGFKDKRALQIDHVNSNGANERKLLTQREILYRVIEHPEDYQVLCANCNAIKKITCQELSNRKQKMAGN